MISKTSGNLPVVKVHTSTLGSVMILACDAQGRAVRLNDPQLVTAAKFGHVKNAGQNFEAASSLTGVNLVKTGFHEEGSKEQSLEYSIPGCRLFGGRPFKKADLKLDFEAVTKCGVRTWPLKGSDQIAAKTDLFLLFISAELYRWWTCSGSSGNSGALGALGLPSRLGGGGPDQILIESVLDAMSEGRRRGEEMLDVPVKHLLKGALKAGAPEQDLSALCLSPAWIRKSVEHFLDKRALNKNLNLDATAEDSIDDMFA